MMKRKKSKKMLLFFAFYNIMGMFNNKEKTLCEKKLFFLPEGSKNVLL